MLGNQEVLALLNELLTNELTAINQYFLHAKMCGDWGYEQLAAKLREESLGETEHADALMERILFLEGAPNMQRYHTIISGKTVKEQLEANLEREYAAIAALNQGIAKSRELGDNATEDLLTTILVAEQEDTQWLESQLELMSQMGEQNYLAQQIKK
jgi:bacterioferritin